MPTISGPQELGYQQYISRGQTSNYLSVAVSQNSSLQCEGPTEISISHHHFLLDMERGVEFFFQTIDFGTRD